MTLVYDRMTLFPFLNSQWEKVKKSIVKLKSWFSVITVISEGEKLDEKPSA